MSKQLYEEALADVKKLKEIAEDNAKKALIEAVSPRIKDLIESELLKEVEEDDKKDDLLLDKEPEGKEGSKPDEEDASEGYALNNESLSVVSPIIDQLNIAAKLQVESKLFNIGESVEKFLGAGAMIKKTPTYQSKILEMVSEVEDLYEYLQESAGNLRGKEIYEGKLEDLYKKLNKLVEQENMKRNRNSLNEADVTLKLTGLPDEVDLESLGVDLISDEGEEGDEEGEDLDLGGDEDEEGEDLDLGGDEGEEEEGGGEEEEEETAEEGQQMESRRLSDNVIVEIDENMLRREISRMRSLREESEKADVQAWGHGPGKVSSEEDFEADDLGDPFLDGEVTTESQDVGMNEYEMDELDHEDDGMLELDMEAASAEDSDEEGDGMLEVELDEDDMMQAHGEGGEHSKKYAQPSDQSNEPGKTVESLRRKLASEAQIQAEAKQKAGKAKAAQKKASKDAQDAEQQAQTSAKKGQKGEAQKKKAAAASKKKDAKKLGEAYAHYANVFNESVRRTAKLKSMLTEASKAQGRVLNNAATRSTAETDNLRKKLAETNLFNMKLLYSNKLLQNESLTKRQKAEVIERLDEAASEREVKLVYESLVKALSTNSRQISEGARPRVLGSSSQATRPAATVISEGYEADRWAKLAGIK